MAFAEGQRLTKSPIVEQSPKNANAYGLDTLADEDEEAIKELEKALSTPIPNIFTALTENEAVALAKKLAPRAQGLASWEAYLPALQRSQQYVASKTDGQVAIAHGYFVLTWGDLAKSLKRLIDILPKLNSNPELLAKEFVWARLDKESLFSGYYEPIFDAHSKREGSYQYPLYRRPKDLQELDLGRFDPKFVGQRIFYRMEQGRPVPYYDREAIDKHAALKGQGLEFAWLKDPFDVFTLQLQGSGLLRMRNNKTMAVAYAGRNGLPYVSIGEYLRDQRHIPTELISMPTIRKWLKDNPHRAERVMHQNKSYVFFQEVRRLGNAPVGSMNKPLTPYVSLATDTAIFPFGAITVFNTHIPYPNQQNNASQKLKEKELFGLGLPQDTGTAMIGSRVDLFCGTGDEAGMVAGSLRSEGTMWLLLAKD